MFINYNHVMHVDRTFWNVRNERYSTAVRHQDTVTADRLERKSCYSGGEGVLVRSPPFFRGGTVVVSVCETA